MKKLIALLTIVGFMALGINNLAAQNKNNKQKQDNKQEEVVADEAAQHIQDSIRLDSIRQDSIKKAEEAKLAAEEENNEEETAPEPTFRESIKSQFIDGGPLFMGIVLVILLLGMAISIERIIYLTMADANSSKLLAGIEKKMAEKDVDGAKQLCKNTRGPVASIFTQGLIRYQDGQSLEDIEKSLVSYGAVAAGKLESGLSWVGLCISLAPMFGFMGTVIGMIQAFDAIAAAGDMSPKIVASGMKVALLTTVFGLIAAIILQVFFNFIASKIEKITSDMENASISFMDILVKYSK